MKFLRNPWVVGLLVAMAVGLVAYQTLSSRRRPAATVASQPPAPPAPVEKAGPPPPAAVQPAPAPGSGPVVDNNYAESHLAAWINSPRRDPFLQPNPAATGSPPPPPRWKLKAIWRQGGVTMAAINQDIYQMGDILDGYIILNINDNEVWLGKNGQKIFLTFGNPEPVKANGP